MKIEPDEATRILKKVRQEKPLVHNLTNYVVMNSSANILLAIGASPVMAHAIEEMEEMVSLAGALVLNIGTLDRIWIQAMLAAGKRANERGIPIVLDPVGSGATAFRTATARQLLEELHVAVLRANASEILSLSSRGAATRGVDSQNSPDEARAAGEELARRYKSIVAISGETDFITDGVRMARVANGHPLMTSVTGLGCGLSAVAGAFCAVHSDHFAATTAAFCAYGLAGEIAAKRSEGPGTFVPHFLDSLYGLDEAAIKAGLRLLTD